MLTDLSFLNIGAQFPPLSEHDRLEMYRTNRNLFENGHAVVYAEAFKRIERVIENFNDVVSYPVIMNYQKLVTLKFVDLLFAEPPKIVCGEYGSKEQITVDTIRRNSDLNNTSYEAGIDLSRYGDGLFYIYKDPATGKGMIDVTQPPYWFPIVDPMNIKRFTAHVLAWTFFRGQAKYLKVQVHERGFYTEKEFLLEGGDSGWHIKTQTGADQKFETGLDDFAIVPVQNVVTSDRVHGMDDYTDIDSIVSELLVRVGQVSKILDKHASPSVSGPISALERDPYTGKWQMKLGNYFVRDGKEDAEVKYITWDGQLEAAFQQIDILINMLHAMSEVGAELLGDKPGTTSGVSSGTALRFKMVSPLVKAKRISLRFAPALEKAIRLCSQLGGDNVVTLTEDKPISITFMDGLPNDPLEESTIMMNRTGNKATMSIQRALEVYDGMTPDDAENEVKRIDEDETKANPLKNVDTDFNGNNEPGDGEGE